MHGGRSNRRAGYARVKTITVRLARKIQLLYKRFTNARGTMAEPAECRWLLLFHQIPPRPSYFRVKIWRRLQRLGAVAVKNAVYALPKSDQAQEDLQWVLREITEGGG